ncbi:type II toxin-antitoxin system HipA family toxin [Escherichia coli]|nr:type II toxin-antitoxin system HipA family toxin [Salmonella enterica]EEO0096103.1 type II toxin-antitoxin system HipA family toxin [Salmonella enterica subsp. enterica serovar Senftenberg]EFP2626630.1 type II toxin-antitoxin system HipA family toxin [Salmonella enterica subsp. enterica serovar Ohio]EGD0397215.1 type II toxin-antitoxin system HipA family toxin [Salmonella enterica subsp. enterica serovar Agona]EGK3607907.1 type II toxin-antitoxin system HipA family toxin [Escherichia coli]
MTIQEAFLIGLHSSDVRRIIQWLIFLLIGNTMKNTMLRKGLTIF